MKINGVDNPKLRQLICEEYIFSHGQFLDAGWIKSDGKTVWPELCFAERPIAENGGLGEIQTLYVTSDHFAFHEYAFGNAGEYFEERGEDASEIETGTI